MNRRFDRSAEASLRETHGVDRLQRDASGHWEVSEPAFRNEQEIAIAAGPARVWPWLAQMGFGRAGWYSWDLIDNLGRPSAVTLHHEWMVREAGDEIPGGPIAFDTPVVDPPHQLVITTGRRTLGLWTVDFALSYLLTSTGSGSILATLATGRIEGPLGEPLARRLLGPGDAFMVRKQLRGVRDRAERTSMSLATDLLDAEIAGHGVTATTMGELLDERPTLLVFLRHFG